MAVPLGDINAAMRAATCEADRLANEFFGCP
jgi:hypothetical protein